MTRQSGSGIVAAAALLLIVGLGGRPGMAHNDWGLPLVGGLVGGYALNSVIHSQREEKEKVYVAPPPAAPAPAPVAAAPAASTTATTIENQLNVLDDLAAKGYITQSEYQARRQALLNQL